MKKPILSLLFLLLALSVSLAQSVERTSDPILVSGPLAKLEGAEAWSKYNGVWSKDNKTGDLELRTATIDGKEHLILIRQTNEMRYKYPAIHVDPYYFIANNYYPVAREKLASVIAENPEFNKSYGIDLETLTAAQGNAQYVPTDPREVHNDLFNALGRKERWAYRDDLQRTAISISVFPVIHEGKKKVRYFFEENYKSRKYTFDPKQFDWNYFEVDFDSFYRFFHMLPAPIVEKPAAKPVVQAAPEVKAVPTVKPKAGGKTKRG